MAKRIRPTVPAADQVGRMLREMDEAQRSILAGLVCDLLSKDLPAEQIAERLRSDFKSYAAGFNRQRILDLLRFAAQEKLLRFEPPTSSRVAAKLLNLLPPHFRTFAGDITVVHTAVIDHLAQAAAGKLLGLVQMLHTATRCEKVHIGFAGGRTLRSVAAAFASLLDSTEGRLPSSIVFHAMVAGFNEEEDYVADPNSFVTYFVPEHRENPRPRVSIQFVAMPLPGLIEKAAVPKLRKLRAVRKVYDDAEKVQIIVTSGGSRKDKDSTLHTLMPAAGVSPRALTAAGIEGDLLWQPLARAGAPPLEMDYEISTLMRLQDLPTFIRGGGRFVLLVLAGCGKCGRPKGDLLDLILQQPDPLFTHLVVDTPTVADLLVLRNQPL